MKKTISILALTVITTLLSFRTEQPKTIRVEFTIEEAQAVISAVQSSETISAKTASIIANKITLSYQTALQDSTRKDSTHKK